MSIWRSDPFAPKSLQDLDGIHDMLSQINDKVLKADSDHTYTHSPLEVAMASDKVATFGYLEKLTTTGAKTNVYFSNPSSNGTAKFVIYIDTTDQGEIHVYYDPDVDTSSAVQLVAKPVLVGQNINVNVSAYADVIINTSTIDIQRVIPGGSGRFAQGNTSTGLPGFGLLPGHNIAIEVENTSSNANTVGFLVVYWED